MCIINCVTLDFYIKKDAQCRSGNIKASELFYLKVIVQLFHSYLPYTLVRIEVVIIFIMFLAHHVDLNVAHNFITMYFFPLLHVHAPPIKQYIVV